MKQVDKMVVDSDKKLANINYPNPKSIETEWSLNQVTFSIDQQPSGQKHTIPDISNNSSPNKPPLDGHTPSISSLQHEL